MADSRQTKGQASTSLGAAFLIQAGVFGLGLSLHMLLARWLGRESYGDLSSTLSVALLAATLAAFGFDRAAPQTVSAYGAGARKRLATAFARYSCRYVAAAALLAAALIYGGARAAELAFGVDEHPIRYAGFLVVPMALGALLTNLLGGLRRPVLSQLLGPIAGRLVLLGLAAWVLLRAVASSEILAVGLVGASWILPLVLTAAALARTWPAAWRPVATDHDEAGAWRRTARAFLVATLPLVALDQSGILLMEFFHVDESALGVYAAAHRTAALPMVALFAARRVATPELSVAHEAGPAAVEERLRPFLRFTAAIGIVFLALFVVAGDELLSLFGHATEEGHVILIVLGTTQIVFLWAGLATPLLQLYDQHRLVIVSMAALPLLALAMGPVLIPRWGGEGLAAGYLVISVAVLGHLMAQVQRRTGVRYLRLLAGG